MASEKTFTFSDISKHRTNKDLYVVIHDKVYDASGFVEEHPGGEETLVEVAGIDATDAFEDVGHSDEARGILDKLFIGLLKRMPGDDEPTPVPAPPPSSSSFGVVGFLLCLLISIAAIHFLGAEKYLDDVDVVAKILALLGGESIAK